MPEHVETTLHTSVSPALRRENDPEAARLRAGDTAAFDTLFAQYAPRVMGYALRMTNGDRAEAEEVVSETFLAGYTGRAGYKGTSRPLAWLLGIAVRRWRDKQRKTQPSTLPLNEEISSATATESPENVVVRNATLEAALAELEPPFREALLLVASQGLTYQEAADAMEEPLGTTKWRVHEASRRMRRLLIAMDTADTADRTGTHNERKGAAP
jgi:RNA polymerase sigma-70 factor, ECF subfamily